MDYYEIYDVLLIVWMILCHVMLNMMERNSDKSYVGLTNVLIVGLLLFLCLFWGFRPLSVGTDTGNYYNQFMFAGSHETFDKYLSVNSGDVLFNFFLYQFARNFSYSFFLFFIATMTSLGFYKMITLYTSNEDKHFSVYLLLMLCSLFSFTSVYSNIIRNGVAISISLPFVYYSFHHKIKESILWGGIALLFHSSIWLSFAAVAVVIVFRFRVVVYVVLYFIAAVLSMAGMGLHNLPIVSYIPIEKLQSYSANTSDVSYYEIGFRWDFFLYNTFFLAVFLILLKDNKNPFYDQLIKLYIVYSGCFFFAFHIPYSDRFGIYSWFVIPILVYYSCAHYNVRYSFLHLSIASILFFVLNYVPFI